MINVIQHGLDELFSQDQIGTFFFLFFFFFLVCDVHIDKHSSELSDEAVEALLNRSEVDGCSPVAEKEIDPKSQGKYSLNIARVWKFDSGKEHTKAASTKCDSWDAILRQKYQRMMKEKEKEELPKPRDKDKSYVSYTHLSDSDSDNSWVGDDDFSSSDDEADKEIQSGPVVNRQQTQDQTNSKQRVSSSAPTSTTQATANNFVRTTNSKRRVLSTASTSSTQPTKSSVRATRYNPPSGEVELAMSPLPDRVHCPIVIHPDLSQSRLPVLLDCKIRGCFRGEQMKELSSGEAIHISLNLNTFPESPFLYGVYLDHVLVVVSAIYSNNSISLFSLTSNMIGGTRCWKLVQSIVELFPTKRQTCIGLRLPRRRDVVRIGISVYSPTRLLLAGFCSDYFFQL